MKKQIGIAALGLAGLTAGAGAGLVLTGGSGDASAQTPTTEAPTTEAPTTDDPTAPDTSTTDETRPDPSTWLADALAPLVEDGTITQAQADAVVAAIQDARPAKGEGPGGWGGHGPGMRGGFGLDAVAEALGMTADELRTELSAGKTIAQVGEEKGVELTTVTDAMVSAFTTKVQERVTAGDLTQERADEIIAEFTDRVDDIVTSTRPAHPGKGLGAPEDSTDDSTDDGESTTTAA